MLAQRITYVGELGFELYAGRGVGGAGLGSAGGGRARARASRPAGIARWSRCAWRRATATWARDLTAGDTPYRGGLGFCVALEKGDFIGREALEPPGARGACPAGCARCRSAGEEYLTVYGGEAVRADGAVVGRVRSCAYGYTVRRNVALATAPAELEPGTGAEVDVFGDSCRRESSATPL